MKPDISCISWKSFQPSLSATPKKLYTENNYADVTLVSDDQIQIKAHKFVLSACGPKMENLLLNNFHSHPMLYMKSILLFMYLGEANLKQEKTDKFLEFARDLHINEFMSDLLANQVIEEVADDPDLFITVMNQMTIIFWTKNRILLTFIFLVMIILMKTG